MKKLDIITILFDLLLVLCILLCIHSAVTQIMVCRYLGGVISLSVGLFDCVYLGYRINNRRKAHYDRH